MFFAVAISNPFRRVAIGNLLCLARMSSQALMIAFATLLASATVQAHEVRPSIADFEITEGRINLEIRLVAEAMLARIDLSELADTNDAPEADDYTALRDLPPAELEAKFRSAWPELSKGITIEAAGKRLAPALEGLSVPEVGDTAISRDTILSLSAPLPDGDAPVVLGWDSAYGTLVLRQKGPMDTAYTGVLSKGELSAPIPREGRVETTFLQVATDYIVLGFEHILPKGLDHILFVLGLFFFSLHLRPLLIQVTMFTLAHTITLALGALKIVAINPAIVEPLIAASIAFVAIENILSTKMKPWRVGVIFVFGLLHGLGFASMLNELGLSDSYFITSLVSFNLGVELGQLTVISAAFLLLGLPFGKKPWWRKGIQIPASALISLVAIYWVIERTILA